MTSWTSRHGARQDPAPERRRRARVAGPGSAFPGGARRWPSTRPRPSSTRSSIVVWPWPSRTRTTAGCRVRTTGSQPRIGIQRSTGRARRGYVVEGEVEAGEPAERQGFPAQAERRPDHVHGHPPELHLEDVLRSQTRLRGDLVADPLGAERGRAARETEGEHQREPAPQAESRVSALAVAKRLSDRRRRGSRPR